MTDTPLSHGTWVLIADGEKALFLENEGDADLLDLRVRSAAEQENPPTREQGANRPGRFNDGPSSQRSAVEDTDWHMLAKERFADDLAEQLYKRAHRGEFARIVLVAPPPILGELRKEIHKEVAARVVGEVPKTLTNHSLEQIERLLPQELAASA